MKKPIISISTVILLSVLLMSTISVLTAIPVIDSHQEYSATYKVTNTTNNTNTWYNSDFSESYSYQVTNGSDISVEIDEIGLLNPELNITIGNLTRTSILDTEVDSNLGLGYWELPNVFGLTANTSWNLVEQDLNKIAFTQSSFRTDQSFQFQGQMVDTVEIFFTDDFQSTGLVYDQDSGILYSANVTIGNFKLAFEIVDLIYTVDSSPNIVTYEVIKTTNNSYTWFNADFSESYNYIIPSNSMITVEFSDILELNPLLNITIGNLTRTNIYDTEVDSNLGLGYWELPNVFGFTANTSWSQVEEDLNGFAFNSSSLKIDTSYIINSEVFQVVKISFKDDFQSTELIYGQNSGILYAANVTIGNFELSFETKGILTASDIKEADADNNSTDPISSTDETVTITEETGPSNLDFNLNFPTTFVFISMAVITLSVVRQNRD